MVLELGEGADHCVGNCCVGLDPAIAVGKDDDRKVVTRDQLQKGTVTDVGPSVESAGDLAVLADKPGQSGELAGRSIDCRGVGKGQCFFGQQRVA